MPEDRRRFFVVLLTIVCLSILLLWWTVGRPHLHHARQVRNVVAFQAYEQMLIAYRDEHGQFPSRLEEALLSFRSKKDADPLPWLDGLDSWGNPILYLSEGEIFILVSCGLDGIPDGTNYLQARSEPRRPEAECDNPAVDQVLSDQGWYRGCGK